jgi:hypothetical protein|tara:strand:+ start:250 stop:450 length:201 start_codon:yes stop_codon:yes gene_type:complete
MTHFENMFEALTQMHKRMDEFDSKDRDENGQLDIEAHDWDFAEEMETMFRAMTRFEEAMERAKKKA